MPELAEPGDSSSGGQYEHDIDAYAADAGISLEQAAQNLKDQRNVGRLAELCERRLGESFGGLWIDADGDQRIKVGLVGPARGPVADRVIATAWAVIAEAGLDGKADLVKREHSLKELEAVQHRMETELARLNPASPMVRGVPQRVKSIDAIADVRAGVVEVWVPRRDELTDEQAAFVWRALEDYGPAVRLRAQFGWFRLDSS